MMRTRLTFGAMSLLVSLMTFPACGGIQPTAAPEEQPVNTAVDEAISVTDNVQVLPPVVISIGEAVTATDEVEVLPPVVISVGEAITATDNVQALPPVVISVGETITTTDEVEVLSPPAVTPTSTPTPFATPPDLAIEKLLNSEYHYGQSGSYTFQIGNVGTGTAHSPITLVDVLPGGITFDSYSDPFTTDWACSASGQQVTCKYTGPDISPGGFLPALIITVTIAPIDQFPGGSDAVDNCAQVRHPDDVNPENDQSCVSTVITPSGAAGPPGTYGAPGG